jgi:hypothetical protein
MKQELNETTGMHDNVLLVITTIIQISEPNIPPDTYQSIRSACARRDRCYGRTTGLSSSCELRASDLLSSKIVRFAISVFGTLNIAQQQLHTGRHHSCYRGVVEHWECSLLEEKLIEI